MTTLVSAATRRYRDAWGQSANNRFSKWRRFAAFLLFQQHNFDMLGQKDMTMAAVAIATAKSDEEGNLKPRLEPGESGKYQSIAAISRGLGKHGCEKFEAWLVDPESSPYALYRNVSKMKQRPRDQ